MSEPTPRLTRASEPFERPATQSGSRPDTACDSLLDTVRSTFDPFKQTFSTDGSTFHHVSEAVNSLASLQSMPSQLLNTGIAQVPLLDKMPGMPAATIGVPHLGTPHAHSHPPSSGFPLPSVGATIGSGCLSVLIGGIPAARVLDIGIAPTCGGLTPYFDIQTGSSNTFIGGMRAVRMGIDMTRHCNPMGHVGKSGGEAAGEATQVTKRAKVLGRAGKVWKVGNAAVGPAAGGMTAGDDASQGEIAAAAMMAAQTAADLAMMLLGNLMGKDPGIEPSMGTLLVGNPTVLIGGFPLPDSQMMWHGAKHGLGKRVRPKLPVKLQELACEFWGEPVSAVTGDVRNDFTDYETNDTPPFIWGRHYSTGWHERDGALGYGFRHTWQHELQLLRTRAVYVDPRGTAHTFARGQDGHYCGCSDGYEIEQFDECRFVVRHDTAGDVEFVRSSLTDRIARCVYHRHNGVGSALHWSADSHLERITQSDGSGKVRRAISLRHDTAGRVFEVVVTHADGAVDRIVRYAYDAHGCLIRQQDALNASAHYTYDARRRMTRLTDANGYAFSYRYDEQGRCVESGGQDGLWHVQLAYQAGRTIVTESDGAQWSVFYNDAGTITRVVDPFGGATEYILGVDGRILEEIDSGGRTTRWLYDARGRNTGRRDRWGNRWPPKDEAPVLPDVPPHIVPDTPLGVQWGEIRRADQADTVLLPPEIAKIAVALLPRPARSAAVQRDAAGRIVARTDAYGYAEQSGLDPVGNLLVRRDRDGRDYRYGIASWNLRESETDPLGNTIRYRYSAKAEVTAIVDANGNESSYAYDYKGRIVSVMRHGVVRETYAYDTGDRLIEKRDGAGALLLRFEVGENGLHCKRILASGQTHHYEYNARGQFTRASTDTFEVRLAYDARGRRIADKRDGRGIDHFHVGRWLARTTYLDRYTVHYEPSADGEVLIRTPDGGTHRIHRASDGRILLCLGNGSNVLYGFDVHGRNGGRLTWRDAREGSLRFTRYEYGPTGELRRVVDSARDTIEYEYDDAHRMICERRGVEPVRRFAYDRGGNLLSSAACRWLRYADGNRLHVSSNGQFRYNGRNHLAERVDENNRGITYEYDSMDLLVKIRKDGCNDTWTAEYDGLCRRIRQSSDADQQIDYYWDGDRLAAEISKKGRLRLYVYPNSTGFLPFMLIDYLSVDAAPDDCRTYFVIHNQVGQPEWIEDETGNTVWRSERIDPYGTIEIADDNLIEYNLRFPGHYFDPTTGLHCNRFRTYDPVLARYLQSDPAGQSGGINLYAYTSNPLLHVDLFGLSTCGPKSDKQGHDDNGSIHEDPAKPGHESDDDGSTAPDSPQPKPLVQVHPSDSALFDPVRKDADAMRLAFRKALGDRNRSTTLLPFIYKKKDGTFEIGIGASGDGANLLSSDPKLAAIAAGHTVVSAPPDPSGPDYPRFTNNEKHEESTDQHAEQQSLRWADSQPDIEGVAYFAPTAHVCEGCRQAIYDRAPYDSQKQKLAFDPDDTIAPKAQSKYFNPPANDSRELPAHFIPGARDRALDEYLNPAGPQPTKKAVAERYGISPSTLKKWIDKKLEGTL